MGYNSKLKLPGTIMVEKNFEYTKAVDGFEKANGFLSSAVQAEMRATEEALDLWYELEHTRKRWLTTILEEQGLELCERYVRHWPLNSWPLCGKPTGAVPHENVGLFPNEQIKLIYSERRLEFPFKIASGETSARTYNLKRLCQQHLPEELDITYSYDQEGKPNFRSEVVEQNGRFITRLHSIDITDKVWKHYPEEVYQFFGLPELPPEPQIVHNSKTF